MSPRKLMRSLALSLLTFLPILSHSAAADKNTFSFGIGPQQSASELAKRWIPVLNYLSEKSGISIQFQTAKDIPTFQQQMKEGLFDFSFINPYHYTIFHTVAGYDAFAHEVDGNLIGIIVVKKNGPTKDIKDLDGKTLAFPAANALAATWLPTNYLTSHKIGVSPQYVKSMDSVYLTVAKGIFPAGGGELRTFELLDPAIRDQLNILWKAEPLPSFPFSAHPRVPAEVVHRLQAAMIAMSKDGDGRKLLHAIRFKGIEAATDSDYDALRKMQLKPVKP